MDELAAATREPQLILDVKIVIPQTVRDRWLHFKAESDDLGGEVPTPSLSKAGTYTYRWHMGPWKPSNSVWFWWDTLNDTADITIGANGTTLLDATCSHVGGGEIRVASTFTARRLYKTVGSPWLAEGASPTTYILRSPS